MLTGVQSDLAENEADRQSTMLINCYFHIFLRTLQVHIYTDIVQNFPSNM